LWITLHKLWIIKSMAQSERFDTVSDTMFLKKKKPLLVPDSGQRVELVGYDGSVQSSFRAISGSLTIDTGEVIVWMATEEEYRDAEREGRRAVGLPWPAERIEALVPRRERRRLTS
jgi:hypothetical protein